MSILQMSLQAGVLIAAIVVFRAFALYKLPKSSFLVLWGVVLARMLVPFSFASKFSAYNFLDVFKIFYIFTARKKPGATLPAGGAAQVYGQFGNFGNSGSLMETEQFGQTSCFPVFSKIFQKIPPLTALWIGVMMLLLVASCLLLARSYRLLRDAVPMENSRFAGFVEKWTKENRLFRPLRVLQSDRIASPASHGILRPCIIFPRHMDMGVDRGNARMLEYILFHEYVHIRRFDTLWKLTALCAACVHWFNPLAWVMLFLLNRDLEISCDEMVLRHFGAANRGAYARSLIGMAGRDHTFSFVQNHFCKKAAEERIIAIMKYKKFSVLATVFAMILVVGLAAAFTTSAKASANANGSGTTEVPGAPVDYAVYETYGLIYDEQNGYYTYDGKIVRHFNDPANGAGFTNFYSGTVDLEAERDAAGSLTGIRECSKELYDLHTQKQNHLSGSPAAGSTDTVQTGSARSARSVWLIDYEACGITYDVRKHGFYYGGQRVKTLIDGAVNRVYWTDEEDGISLAVRRTETGEITGLEEATADDFKYPVSPLPAGTQIDEADLTERACVHGWKHGTDLMLGDTMLECHGGDDRGGYVAIYGPEDYASYPTIEAEDIEPSGGISDAEEYTGAKSELCPRCGAVRPISVVWTDIWDNYEAVPCPDDPEGTDTIQRMYGILTSECPSCGYFKSPYVYQTRTVCGETDGYWIA